MAWTRRGARKASDSSIAVDRTERLSRCARSAMSRTPPCDKFVEPASGLGEAGEQLGLGVRSGRARAVMSALDRGDKFAADARGRLPPGNDHGRFSNDRRSLSRERDL